MAISVLQTKMGTRTNVSISTSATNTCTADSNTTANSTLVVVASVAFGAATNIPTLTCSDSQGNTYTSYGGTAQGRVRTYIFVAGTASAAALTTTITASSSDTTTAVGLDQCIVEVAGSSGVEDSGTAAGNSADGTGGEATTVANGIIISGITRQGAAAITEPGGWTLIGESESETCSYIYKTSTGETITPQWTFTSANWAGTIIALHEPSTGTVVPIVRYRRMLEGVV